MANFEQGMHWDQKPHVRKENGVWHVYLRKPNSEDLWSAWGSPDCEMVKVYTKAYKGNMTYTERAYHASTK